MNEEPILQVVFFRMESGREPVREWLKELDTGDRKTIGEDIKLVQFRWPLGAPLVDNMNQYSGSSFDDFLDEEGILDEVTATAYKRLWALQVQDAMAEAQLSKSELAGRLQTSRSQLDRLLDPENTAVTLDSMERLARAVGKQLVLRLA